MAGSGPRMIRANGVELCIETFGEPTSPAILLIAGAAMSMDWWDDELCERLAAGPRFVIRYDLRDTGQSVSYEPGVPEYRGRDLVEDAVGILDVLGISRAHVVAISMGGGLAQLLAVDHPSRVSSLTLLSTSPGGSGLPPSSDRLRSHFADPSPEPEWTDREAVVDYLVDDLRAYAGTLGSDEAEQRALVERVVDRTVNIASSSKNHWVMATADDDDDSEPLRTRLRTIEAPTLVLHGTEDPLFPLPHGEALAAEIPGARLVTLEDMGHEVPPRQVWDQVVPAILDHTEER
jgi:pimeloyl-ACP methyl ester carboxylesterase